MPGGRTPEETDSLLAQAISSNDVDAAVGLFTEDGVFADPSDGTLVTGADALRRMFAGWLPMGPQLQTDPPQVLIGGDVALVVGTWTLQTPGPDGQQLTVTGTAASVTRRGDDELWRYAVNNPAGTELPVPSGA